MDMTLLKSVGLVLLCGLRVASIHAADDPSLAKMQGQMEAAAQDYSHFATGDIIANRPTDREWPEKLIAEQSKLMADLQKWAKQPEFLRALIGHRDARVRTLVLGALFVREDPRDLPLIGSLAADETPTFVHVHATMNSAGFTGNLADIEDPQTVGQVADAMLATYLRAAYVKEDCEFADYWQAREGRQTCASWLLVRISRATRNTSPPQPEYQRDVRRVISELRALPPAERAWTQVFLRCTSFTDLEATLTDATCVAALKEIGPDEIVRFLERQRVTEDPDLWFDDLEIANSRVYSWMAHFILRRACELLLVQDAPALLACEEFQRNTNSKTLLGTSPGWAAAAAELIGQRDPAAANQVINAALGRFPLSHILGGRYQAVLIGSLWRINGQKQKQEIVDWLYQAHAKVTQEKSDESNHGPADFLRSVQRATRADTKELMVALVADPRFDQADWPSMKWLLAIASDGLPEPLVSQQELYSVWPPRDGREKEVLAQWRERLKRHYNQ